MKKLTGGLVGLLIGEFLVLSHKDKTFKSTVQKKKGWDKIEYIVSSLFMFNKKIIENIHQDVKNTQRKDTLTLRKIQAEKEYILLKTKIKEIKANIEHYDEKDLQLLVNTLTTKREKLVAKIQKITTELDEKYDLEEKVVAIKHHIDTLHISKKKK